MSAGEDVTDPTGAPRIPRRRLLGAGLLGAAALVASGCGAGRRGGGAAGPPATTPATVASGPITGGSPSTTAPPATGASTTVPPSGPPTSAQWAALASSLTGSLVRPEDSGYPADVELFDFRYDGIRPAGIAYCATPDDVARSIDFARRHGMTPTPRAGGHSYAGYSLSSGLVVDVTRMATVTAPPSGSVTAAIGAGARLIDVYSGLTAAGVCIPGGSCPTVGLSGLALGGGIGVVCRLHGLTADRVTSLRVVTADSRTVTASATSNPDLYWACRGGGGGNFGVVTSWEMETFPTSEVSLFTLVWPWAAADQVLPAWQAWMPAMPDELWSTCLVEAVPGRSEPEVVVTGVLVGPTSAAAPLLARLSAVTGAPQYSRLTPSAFSDAMYHEAGCAGLSQAACHLPTQDPAGTLSRAPSVAKSDMLTAPLPDAGIRVVVDAVTARQEAGLPGAVAYDALGGAISSIAPGATAWAHRDALFSVQYSVPLVTGVSTATVATDKTWLSGMYAALRPFVSGQAYQNYIDPDLTDWASAYYGANLPRLESLRRTWDPDRTWDFARAIPLAT